MNKDETAKWLQAFGGGEGDEPAANRVDACYTPEYLDKLEAEYKSLPIAEQKRWLMSLSTLELTGLVMRYIGRDLDGSLEQAKAAVRSNYAFR